MGAREALRVVWRALEGLWDHLFASAMLSALWWLSLLLIAPLPPATVALLENVRRLQAREEPTAAEFARAVWAARGTGWRWGLLAAGGFVVLGVDANVAVGIEAPLLRAAAIVLFLVALGVWGLLQLYALPLLFEQERPEVLRALRNAGVMALHNPLFTLTLALAGSALLWLAALSVILFLLWGPAFVAWLGMVAVEDRLRVWRARLPSQAG